MKLTNSLNYDPRNFPGRFAVGQSHTVPNAVMTLPEIITRFTRKLAIPHLEPTNSELDLSAFQNIDQFERIELARQYKHRVDVLNNQLILMKANDAKAKAQAEFDKAVADKVSEHVKQKGVSDVA